MTKIVGIGFKDVGKIYWFNPGPFNLQVGSKVVVETIRGLELGHIVQPIKEISDEDVEHDLKDVIRVANEKDLKSYEENEEKAKKSFSRIKEIIKEYKLEMKTVGCEYTLDGSKLLIYYNADGRVDFRELVKVLASEFRVRIELRQIGPREGAKMIGALGTCGREACCKSHLREFDLVTMKMAKDQGMALSTNKIAGVCGKLMCCIAYENKMYEDARQRIPGIGDTASTPSCPNCKVINVDYVQEKIKTDNQGQIEVWEASQVKKIKSAKKEQEQLTIDEKELQD